MILVNKITGAFAVWLMVCAAILVLAIGPAVANLFNIESKIKERDVQIAASVSHADQIEIFKEFSKNKSGDLVKIGGSFVNAQNPLEMIDFLENSARDSGVKMEILSSSDVLRPAKGAWPSFNFQMALTGGFSSIAKFAKTIESGKYLVFVPSFSILSEQNTDYNKTASGSLKATVTLTAYVNGNE